MNNLPNVRKSYLSEYFGLWMVYQSQFEKIVSKFDGFNLKAHIEANSDHKIHAMGDEGTPYRVVRPGVAQIDVCGPMMKYSSSMSANCSTTRVRREISHAIANDDIQAILFNFDTPGGTVSGTQDLANAVRSSDSRENDGRVRRGSRRVGRLLGLRPSAARSSRTNQPRLSDRSGRMRSWRTLPKRPKKRVTRFT